MRSMLKLVEITCMIKTPTTVEHVRDRGGRAANSNGRDRVEFHVDTDLARPCEPRAVSTSPASPADANHIDDVFTLRTDACGAALLVKRYDARKA